ncbi:enoyl-CoA hydratase-related protein [Niveispirillum sp.]|uniref:enoyl-CoA hydratase-related protein n=1 Tax=Niveispirillum sp. TaxID=1917217 RepID=UPI001B54B0FE|nr:enoyl-CoA hydratase-related protein [Niveispirillum sp.]MBP7334350.1 enoyl-CoA hydratase/isomerase family protein [Niveispirillum sp.]
MTHDNPPPLRLDRDGAVGIVTLDRPERMNALDMAMRQALAAAFTTLAGDPAIRVIIVTGGDKVFAAGADLRLLADKGPSGVRDLGFPDLWRPIADCPKPVIAAVAGPALGAGCELALMCDIIIADRTARFGQPEVRVGIMPGAGGTQRLLRVLGKHMASHLLMTGGTLEGERAFALGLACELAEDGATLSAARKLAGRVAALPPLALAAIKRTLAAGADLPLAAANALENREFLLLFDTDDQKEGMAAFLEKRPPDFHGR